MSNRARPHVARSQQSQPVAELFRIIKPHKTRSLVDILFMVIQNCDDSNTYRLSGRPLLMDRALPNRAKARRSLVEQLDAIYDEGRALSDIHSDLGYILEELVACAFDGNPQHPLRSTQGKFVVLSQVKLKDESGTIIDIGGPGQRTRTIDVLAAVVDHSNLIIKGFAVEAKYRLTNYLNEPAFDRKLRYLCYIAENVIGLRSWLVVGSEAHRQEMEPVLQGYCSERGIGVVPIMPFAELWVS